jgi:hypothetical protein
MSIFTVRKRRESYSQQKMGGLVVFAFVNVLTLVNFSERALGEEATSKISDSQGVAKEVSGQESPKLSEAAEIAKLRSSRLAPNRALAPPLTPAEERAREAARKRGDYTFDDIKFEIEKDQVFKNDMLTPAIRELDRKKIRIRGFILPSSVFQMKGIKNFVLVRDDQECCFGPGAAIYDCIMIEMIDDNATDFYSSPVAVTGTFVIDTESYQYPDGGHFAIFKMLATDVKRTSEAK